MTPRGCPAAAGGGATGGLAHQTAPKRWRLVKARPNRPRQLGTFRRVTMYRLCRRIPLDPADAVVAGRSAHQALRTRSQAEQPRQRSTRRRARRISRRQTIASLDRTRHTNSQATGAGAVGLRAQRQQQRPLRANPPPVAKTPARERHRTDPRPSEVRETGGCVTAAATNGCPRERRQAATSALPTAAHAAGADRGPTIDGGEETATRQEISRSNGSTLSRRLSIAASRTWSTRPRTT